MCGIWCACTNAFSTESGSDRVALALPLAYSQLPIANCGAKISAAVAPGDSLHQGIYQRLFAIIDLILHILPRIYKFPSTAGI